MIHGAVRQLAALLLLLVLASLAIRLAWELLAPALPPLSVIVLVVVLAVAAYRRR